MKSFRSGKLHRTLIRLQKKLVSSKRLILMYHRIAEVELALWGLCVTPQHFAEQLEVLQQSNCFDLPRFGVDNWNGKEFAKQLSRWFYG